MVVVALCMNTVHVKYYAKILLMVDIKRRTVFLHSFASLFLHVGVGQTGNTIDG